MTAHTPRDTQRARLQAVSHRLQVDPEFYEPLERYRPRNHFLSVAETFVPVTSQLIQEAFWTHVKPLGARSLMQGWKIHVSATQDNATTILEKAGRICVKAGVPFKFASDRQILSMLLSKGCARGSSGKFMTIYPRSVESCQELLDALYEELKDQEGPYILSDRRYKDSKVVYYRYGGILPFTRVDASGGRASFLLSPTLEEVPDERTPYFQLPEWISDPFQAPEEDTDLVLGGGRFEITSVLNHSNTGGVYLALDHATGQQVVVKEARPHINVSVSGADAVDKLRKEHRLLTSLSGTGIAPEPVAFFVEWEHAFLVQERIEGHTLHGFAAQRSKAIRVRYTVPEVQAWFRQVRSLAVSTIRLVARLHDRGIAFGDLSANNIMVTNPEAAHPELRLIDFEGACEIGVDGAINMFTPGYAPAARLERRETHLTDDHYALGALMLGLIMPITIINGVKPDAYEVFGRSLERDFDLPPAYMDAVLALTQTESTVELHALADALEALPDSGSQLAILTPTAAVDPERLQAAAQGALKYALAVADFGRDDRLFPAGPQHNNPLSLDHGALGVALALQTVTGHVPSEVMDWIARQPLQTGRLSSGYLGGLGGVASALHRLGQSSLATRALQAALRHPLLFETPGLATGASGAGLAALELHRTSGEDQLLQQARRIGAVLTQTAQVEDGRATWPTLGPVQVGLAGGGSGMALFLLTLFVATQDEQYLQLGRQALAADIAQGRRVDGEEALGFPERAGEGNILYPYLMTGSAGVGSVLLRFHHVAPEAGDEAVLEGIHAAVAHKYTLFPGLHSGLAGLGMYALDAYQFLQDPRYLQDAHRAAEGTLLFGVQKPQGLAFPGDHLHRISTDLGTGGAGIAVFLHRLAQGGAHPLFPDALLQRPAAVHA
ncbi:class III lanthionine synthetase LanKC [Deinococcus sp. QL22]|uniref:class III lanthionine synthetase LanKC n=1 Tax=Deinococcus sp. QL22 TaxID=2939437 RepID=UPI0020175A53|nr:class III lanthionine synthetase LanKC [Deinococcus sp. QL22]UQN09432.1 class III lanthionine synthetase LanKC [Deinococcus sp. QL22]